ncbi:MAG: GbsR/MarR family transcriptional regulator [Actinopolymorphaceae bacterium]
MTRSSRTGKRASARASASASAARPAPRDDEAVRRFVERLAMTLDDMGVPRMPARVLSAMMAADEESLTAADLAERLDVSPAAISGAVRYLLHLGLIAREPVRGARTHHYRLPDDVWYESSNSRRGMVKTVADVADEGVEALGGPNTPSGRRVAEMGAFYRFMEAEMDSLFDRWQAARATRDSASS